MPAMGRDLPVSSGILRDRLRAAGTLYVPKI
jgi:hypothetical protein